MLASDHRLPLREAQSDRDDTCRVDLRLISSDGPKQENVIVLK